MIYFFFPSHLKHWKNYQLFRNIWLLSVAGFLSEGLTLARACSPFTCFFGLSPFSVLHSCKTANCFSYDCTMFKKKQTQNQTHTRKSCSQMGTITCGWISQLDGSFPLSEWYEGSIIKQAKWYQTFVWHSLSFGLSVLTARMAATCSLFFLWEHAPVIFQCRRR